MSPWLLGAAGGATALLGARWLRARWLLSRAKHPSLGGHARIARRVAKLIPFYEYGEDELFACDDAPRPIAERRRQAFEELGRRLAERSPRTIEASEELADGISDVAFTGAYRVPFQFRNYVRARLRIGSLLSASEGARVRDLDGNWSYDLGGSYGLNLFGYDLYKRCIERAVETARALGPVLGAYHPVIASNVRRLKEISGLDEVSFHMSGTEAVMQAVRLARYHTDRSHVVRFCGSYHGWWDGVQAGVGNPRPPHEVYTLKEMDAATLRVLDTRKDIACVLVNPIQAMHPNRAAPSDSMLVTGERDVRYDKATYVEWLRKLRDVCTRRGIVLILDEVFLGFRLARGGAQEYFGVRADLVTYGKAVGGGLPIGVVCGRRDLMRRYRDDRPSDICFARGTFNSHPYVMAAMSEFLDHLDRPEVRRTWQGLDERWDARARDLNERLQAAELPLRVANLASVFATTYVEASRFHWMLQYYLRAEGLSFSWVGTGRFIFANDLPDADWSEICDRLVAAATAMQGGGWWWRREGVTNRWIKRRVSRELLAARFARRPSDRAAAL